MRSYCMGESEEHTSGYEVVRIWTEGFGRFCSSTNHITKGFKILWHGLFFLHGRKVHLELKTHTHTRQKKNYNFEELTDFANRRHCYIVIVWRALKFLPQTGTYNFKFSNTKTKTIWYMIIEYMIFIYIYNNG